ncbi:hypothetical protein BCR44DRAFT_1424688 [Catenaria anguillulae PL171]|uniref:Rho-GAP domain-containing protein n=1 Tax=Catenaria anguillulae PL171 TaxID=765915 RepID=A0A1Y2I2R8_9FUNG|nr:hypothetical protein BCR44DRAFT_1424688 [Catenaria anguillulae PL171]
MASFQSRLRGFVGNVGGGVGGSTKDKDKDKDKDKEKDKDKDHGHGHGHHTHHHKKDKEKDKRKSSLTNSSGNLKRGSSLAVDDPDNANADSTTSSTAGSQPNLFSAASSSHHGNHHGHLNAHSQGLGSGMAHSSSTTDMISASDPQLGSSGAQTPNSETGSLERPSSSSASNSFRNPSAQQQSGSNGKLTSSESNESLPDSSSGGGGGGGKASGGGKSSKSKLSKWKDKALEKSEKWMVKANELRHGHGGSNTKKSTGEVSARVFSVPLHAAVAASQIDETCPLPAVVIRSIEFLEAKGMYEVGLYRIPGSSSTVGRLKNVYDCGGDLNLFLEDPPVDPHAVATLLKLFLRELPENILGSYLPHFTEILTTEARPIPLMAALARQLPLPNYYLLSWLCAHLARLAYFSDVNKMTIKNLALIFSWTLQLDSHLLTTLVDHAMELFPLTSDGLVPDEVYKGEDGEGGQGGGAGEYSATYHTANTTALGVVGDDGNSTPEMGYSPPQASAPAVSSPASVSPPVVTPGQAQTKGPPSLPSRPGSPLRAAVTPELQPVEAPATPQDQRRPASVRSMSPTRPTASPPQLNLLGSLDVGARLSMDFADLTLDPTLLPATTTAASTPSRSMTQPVQGASPKLGRSPSPALPPRSATASPRPASPAPRHGDLLVFDSPVAAGPSDKGSVQGERVTTPPPDPFADPSSP